jgi:hypothetical protein
VMKSKSILCISLLVSFLLTTNNASADNNSVPTAIPKIEMQTPYAKVRQTMLEYGWKPYHSINALPCDASDARCQGRPEMQACSDVDLGQCSWLWKKNGHIVLIKTQDDDLFSGASRFYGR